MMKSNKTLFRGKKTILSIATASAVILSLSGCTNGATTSLTPAKAYTMDAKEVCSIDKLGIEKVITNAKMYNDVAIKEKVEFRRLNVNNSDLIIAVEEAIKSGAKMVNPKNFKGKASKTKLETNYAATRACTFALSALQNKHEAKSTWKLAVPGDGYKY